MTAPSSSLTAPDRSTASGNARVSLVGRIVANLNLCREHFRVDVLVDAFPHTEPGEFVQLACRNVIDPADELIEPVHEWGDDDRTVSWPVLSDADLCQRQAVLRRPFSLAGRSDTSEGVVLSVIYRVVGVGTDWLAKLRVGDSIGVLGPLGNRFPKPHTGFGIFIGGGVGIPPLLYLAQRWIGIRLLAICGSTTRDLLPLTIAGTPDSTEATPTSNIAEFAKFGVESIITTDDGTYGYPGLVTTALERYLDRTLPHLQASQRPVLYTCGPEGMMKRIAVIAAERNLDCYVAVERAMACGMGTCQSCVIRIRRGEDWRYALSCTEGPVFKSDLLLW